MDREFKNKVEFLSELLRNLNGLFARNLHNQSPFFKMTVRDLFDILKEFRLNEPPPPEIPRKEKEKQVA